MNKKLTVILKADRLIGTGHLMRVKGLLPFFSGYDLTLVSDSLEDSLFPLCSEYSRIIIAPEQSMADTVTGLKSDLVLIDHYYLDWTLESQLYPHCKIAVIDDLANRKHCCHMLFDQGLLRRREDYKDLVDENCDLRCGPLYSLVKPCFAHLKGHQNTGKSTVLINFGGADPVHACLKVSRCLRDCGLNKKFSFLILSGAANPDHQILEREFSTLEGFSVQRFTDDMPALFAQCDFAIGAYGGSFLERLCAGIPAINVVIADNQRGGPDALAKYQLGVDLGLDDLDRADKLSEALTILMKHADEYRTNGQSLIDGLGTIRIAQALQSLL